ncbi:hypothetical protein K9M42_01315 [Patescibacteria group bacterium]|nr:hypothetical protein [Patescibacteria group bacterium]
MKNKKILLISIILFMLVLIGVTAVEPVSKALDWIEPFLPTIIITGFFTFIVSVSLFVYFIISNIKK